MPKTINLTTPASTGRRLLTVSAAALTVIAMVAPASASPRIPASHPSIGSLHLTPSTVAHGGGAVALKATVHHAAHCKVTSSRSVSGLPVVHSCSNGHLHVTFHVGADPTAAARHITLKVNAVEGSHHTSKTVTLTEAAAPSPSVSGFAVTPTHVAASGGQVHLTATVKNAATCKLSVTPAVAGLPANVACASHAFSHSVVLPADSSATAHSYLFTLVAHGPGGSKTAATHPMATVAGAGSTPISTVASLGAPLPADAKTGDTEDATLDAVSCPSAGHCVAVGQYQAPVSGQVEVNEPGLIETLNGTTWTASAAPLPSDESTTEPAITLNAVSCSSTTACVAVGEYLGNNTGLDPYVATLSGHTWTWDAASVPTDPSDPSVRIGGDLASVSCVSDGCVAVGTSGPPGDDSDALIETPGTSEWTGVEAPLPANADPEEENGDEILDSLKAVSCTAGPSCTAVGGYTTGSGPGLMTVGLGETLSAGIWSASQLPPTADEGYDAAVSCASSSCVATGEYSTNVPQIQTETNGVWNPSDDITAPQPTTANGTGLKAADCATSTSCVLVGEANSSGSSPTPYGLIDSGSGTSYTGTQAPVPTDATTGAVQLTAVSCPIAGSCGAVGSYRGSDATGGNSDDLVEVETTTGGISSWAPFEAPLPSAGSSALGLGSVSCVASWGCVSVGNYSPDGAGETVDGELVAAPL